jgi:hypothetical protein
MQKRAKVELIIYLGHAENDQQQGNDGGTCKDHRNRMANFSLSSTDDKINQHYTSIQQTI